MCCKRMRDVLWVLPVCLSCTASCRRLPTQNFLPWHAAFLMPLVFPVYWHMGHCPCSRKLYTARRYGTWRIWMDDCSVVVRCSDSFWMLLNLPSVMYFCCNWIWTTICFVRLQNPPNSGTGSDNNVKVLIVIWFCASRPTQL